MACVTMDTIPDTMGMVITSEKGLLMLSLLLMPRLIPTTWVDTMACVTMDTIPDTMGMVITLEKGLLMLSLLLMPRLIPTTWVDTMALDTMAMVDTLDIPIGDKLDLECQIKQRPAQMTCPSFSVSTMYKTKHKNKHFSHLYITPTSL